MCMVLVFVWRNPEAFEAHFLNVQLWSIFVSARNGKHPQESAYKFKSGTQYFPCNFVPLFPASCIVDPLSQ